MTNTNTAFRAKHGLTVANGYSITAENTVVNSTIITIGNSTVNSVVTGTGLTIGTKFIANQTQVTIGSGVGLSANGGIGSAGQVLTSNGTSTYWANASASGGGYYKGNDGSIGPTNGNNFFRINSNTQSNNITIAAGENAVTTGPFIIQTGSTLTISTGGRAVII